MAVYTANEERRRVDERDVGIGWVLGWGKLWKTF